MCVYERNGAGGEREEASWRSGIGCSLAGETGLWCATLTSSGSSTHCGSVSAWPSACIPGRHAATAMMTTQRPTTDRFGLGMYAGYSIPSCVSRVQDQREFDRKDHLRLILT